MIICGVDSEQVEAADQLKQRRESDWIEGFGVLMSRRGFLPRERRELKRIAAI